MSWLLLIGVGIVLLDQFTKWWVVHSIPVDQPLVVLTGYLNLVNWRNTGAAWGMFQGFNLVLAVVSVLTVGVIVLFRRSLHVQLAPCRFALGLIIGGITGNLIDRLHAQSVIDFLDFHLNGWHWPAFNVADSAICIGVTLYILASWRHQGRRAPQRA